MSVCDWILLAGAAALALPTAVVALETLAALLARAAAPGPAPADRPQVAVLIPAHDEEAVIAATLAAIMPQLREGDRAVVVADNCADRTAAVARASGAGVVERQDAARRGKGFALAAGIEFLKDAPPAVVVVIDADMRLGAGSIDALVAAVVRHAAPAQALDLLEPPAHAPMRVQVSALAFFFKNHVRALGAEVLGIPCLLRGTGMAFPWKLISGAALATDNLVEDMQLGMDLALAGHAPRFCPAARVTGQVPAETAAAAVQRTRWEHGHLQTILRNVPRLVGQGLKRQRPGLIGLAFDLAVPPLALLVILWCVVALAAGALWAAGLAGIAPLGALAAVGGLLAASILAGWARFARHILPPRTLLSIPFYVLWKVPLYLAFVWKRQHSWIRTERAT